MNLSDYVNASLVTEAGVEKGRSFRLHHASLGLMTEAGELIDIAKKDLVYGKKIDHVHVVEELGDVCWYLAILIVAGKLDPAEVNTFKISNAPELYGKNLGAALDVGGRLIFGAANQVRTLAYMHPNTINKEKGSPILCARVVLSVVEAIAKHVAGIGDESLLSVVFQTNVNKLQKRYGGKFTVDKALNRDIAGERAVLEQSVAA